MILVAKVRSRVLVIDASIARAAGDVSMHPTSRNCREFLQAVLRLCHRMAMTEAIQSEWNRHQGRFARAWRKAMMARRKLENIEVSPHPSLERRIERAVADKYLAAIIEKDRRLIEAALEAEKRVISLDDHVRKHLRDHHAKLPEVRSICWVNPCTPEEQAIAWLESGAPAERPRLLGHERPKGKQRGKNR
jgi:hypothetical protein